MEKKTVYKKEEKRVAEEETELTNADIQIIRGKNHGKEKINGH